MAAVLQCPLPRPATSRGPLQGNFLFLAPREPLHEAAREIHAPAPTEGARLQLGGGGRVGWTKEPGCPSHVSRHLQGWRGRGVRLSPEEAARPWVGAWDARARGGSTCAGRRCGPERVCACEPVAERGAGAAGTSPAERARPRRCSTARVRAGSLFPGGAARAAAGSALSFSATAAARLRPAARAAL